VPPEDLGSFDAVVSDAVLEHVPDMKAFARGAEAALKEGGIFYASWGPLWYGPGGDHVAWGEGASLYSHLLLDSEEYRKRLATNPQKGDDSCDTGFMLEKELFSYLKSEEYFRELAAAGFEFVDCEAKISPLALKALWEDKDLDAALDRKGAPAFDRYCGGYYLWAKKR
jgi:SAM-dependent methyltransferase